MTVYDDEALHLLCANYWVRPIYQELLQSTSSYQNREEKRPCSGLVKVIAHQKPVTTQQGRAHTSAVTDWIGGMCPADTLLVWFPLPTWMISMVVNVGKYSQYISYMDPMGNGVLTRVTQPFSRRRCIW